MNDSDNTNPFADKFEEAKTVCARCPEAVWIGFGTKTSKSINKFECFCEVRHEITWYEDMDEDRTVKLCMIQYKHENDME